MTYLHHLATALIAFDALITVYCLHQDWAREANPGLAKLIAKMGLVPAMALTHGAAIAAVYLLQPMPSWALLGVCGLYGFVGTNNLVQVWKHRK